MQQRQRIEAKPGLFGRSQRSSLLENGQVSTKYGRVLQSKGKAQKIQHRRSRPAKSNAYNEGPNTRQIRANMGRTI